MINTTSDERREVADSLRARAVGVGFAYHDVYALNDGWVYRTLREIVEAIGCAENPRPAEWMARIADLIDPTCHNRQIAYNRASPEEFRTDNFICSTCGELFCADPDGVNHPIDWAYCPNCGARVVRDDGRD